MCVNDHQHVAWTSTISRMAPMLQCQSIWALCHNPPCPHGQWGCGNFYACWLPDECIHSRDTGDKYTTHERLSMCYCYKAYRAYSSSAQVWIGASQQRQLHCLCLQCDAWPAVHSRKQKVVLWGNHVQFNMKPIQIILGTETLKNPIPYYLNSS